MSTTKCFKYKYCIWEKKYRKSIENVSNVANPIHFHKQIGCLHAHNNINRWISMTNQSIPNLLKTTKHIGINEKPVFTINIGF